MALDTLNDFQPNFKVECMHCGGTFPASSRDDTERFFSHLESAHQQVVDRDEGWKAVAQAATEDWLSKRFPGADQESLSIYFQAIVATIRAGDRNSDWQRLREAVRTEIRKGLFRPEHEEELWGLAQSIRAVANRS